MQGAGEAPISWEQHLFPSSLSSENLEVLAEKVGTVGLQGRLNWTWSSISFVQANLQHSIVASTVLSRTVNVKRNRHGTNTGTVVPRGLNNPGYTLFSASGTDRPRDCILTRN